MYGLKNVKNLPERLRKLNVVVVDDNRNMRLLLRSILAGFGVRNVREAQDGQQAIELISMVPPDIMITDLAMWPMDGIELTRFIRTDDGSPMPFLPVIMLTAYADKNSVMKARDTGIHEFLAKPLTPIGLMQRMVAIIDRDRQFIRSEDYVGPDRRRRTRADYEGPFRRFDDEDGDAYAIG